jgi:F420-dependent oxidoreductase-like protein
MLRGMVDSPRPHLLPAPCLVVLVGPSGSGKSTWAAAQFAADEIVSSDRLRAVVGRGEDDLDATGDAFALLDAIVEQRLGRGLTTVVDTLGLDPVRRRAWRDAAARHDVPCVAVGFDVAAEVCRARNRERVRPLPADALRAQLARWAAVRAGLDGEGFAVVLRPVAVHAVPAHLAASAPRAAVQRDRPVGLRFGLHVSSFPWTATAEGLAAVAGAAEAVGFDSLWVMDHVRQIPQVGRDWDPMLESYATLAWLAARTSSVRLGVLVTAVTFRNVGHLAKIVATLDVLSGGRVTCGLGLGWYEREHRAYGWDFPPVPARYELLEDALAALPLLWGPGAPAFEGRRIRIPEAICYPRPLQEHVPVLVGGGGERRTLALAARYADAVNVMGDAAVVRRKVEVLARHGAAAGRDPGTIEVTHLGPALVGDDPAHVRSLVDALRPRRGTPERYAAVANAGTVEDHVGRLRLLAEAGVDHAIVSLPDLGHDRGDPAAAVHRLAPVIAAFRP